jgi:hypothetical protein
MRLLSSVERSIKSGIFPRGLGKSEDRARTTQKHVDVHEDRLLFVFEKSRQGNDAARFWASARRRRWSVSRCETRLRCKAEGAAPNSLLLKTNQSSNIVNDKSSSHFEIVRQCLVSWCVRSIACHSGNALYALEIA